MFSFDTRTGLLALVSAVAVAALFFVGPVPQDTAYHRFADGRSIAGVSNFWNMVSNVAFLVAGALGLWRAPRLAPAESREAYWILCTGAVLVAFGSAYYHHAPTNHTLLWDRLPMTVGFMAGFAMLLNERVFRAPRRDALWWLLAAGIGSALYWSWTESRGAGDLRPYALVQYLPVLLMPLILFLFRPRYLNNGLLLAAFGLYALAKVFELFDHAVFAASGFIGGHALKHVAAAAAVLCLICAVPVRR